MDTETAKQLAEIAKQLHQIDVTLLMILAVNIVGILRFYNR